MRNLYSLVLLLILTLSSCGAAEKNNYCVEGDTITSHADLLTLIDCGDWTSAEIRVPWQDSIPIAKYAVLHPGCSNVALPPDHILIKAPLKSSIVLSSVYTSALFELGCLESVRGVADGSYFLKEDTISKLIAQGKIVDIGSSMSPLIEKAIDAEPDAILLSPYSAGNNTGLEKLGVPMIWMADYLEHSPLGRAEWILLLGELYGKREEAADVFNKVRDNYLSYCDTVALDSKRPVVITEKPMSGTWYVPGGQSYIARMIADAGGCYPWEDSTEPGSIPLDEAAVIDKGADADLWLIKDTKPYSTESLIKELPRAGIFKPFPHNVFYCNTLSTPYYNVIAFHPDRVLKDMAVIFHPELFPGETLEFYELLK